jgi:hypothetical protein
MAIDPSVIKIVDYLNSLLKIDPEAISELFNNRVPCNKKLAYHPTVQVQMIEDFSRVGIIGILNGFFGVYDDGPKKGWGAIRANFDGGKLVKFDITPNEIEESRNVG